MYEYLETSDAKEGKDGTECQERDAGKETCSMEKIMMSSSYGTLILIYCASSAPGWGLEYKHSKDWIMDDSLT